MKRLFLFQLLVVGYFLVSFYRKLSILRNNYYTHFIHGSLFIVYFLMVVNKCINLLLIIVLCYECCILMAFIISQCYDKSIKDIGIHHKNVILRS